MASRFFGGRKKKESEKLLPLDFVICLDRFSSSMMGEWFIRQYRKEGVLGFRIV
jgi:hypothetical protein